MHHTNMGFRLHRPILTTGFFCLTVGVAASAAQACGFHTPDRYAMYPGMTLIRPDMVILLPILSGALERPFYRLAGHRDPTSTLAFSIQANLMAMLAGVAAVIAGIILVSWRDVRLPYWVIQTAGITSMLVLSAIVKYRWFSRVPRDETVRLHGCWFAVATLVSTGTIALIPFWMSLLGTDTYRYAERISFLKGFAILAVLLASLVTHICLFSSFRRPKREAIVARGFEVGPARMPVSNITLVAGVQGQA